MAGVKDANFVEIIKHKLASINTKEANLANTGKVIRVESDIVTACGLEGVFLGESIDFEGGQQGVCLVIDENTLYIAVMQDAHKVRAGDKLFRTQKMLQAKIGRGLLGRTINSLSEPVDGGGELKDWELTDAQAVVPPIMARSSVVEPLSTGIKVVDGLVPIGKGQRQLIIGDRQIGKTTIALDIILNQKALNEAADTEAQKVFCVYVAIGRRASSVANIMRLLQSHGAMEYTTIVAATSGESAAMQYMAPYVGTAIAEYYRDRGLNALIVYDDLTNHAVAYRELSLLMRRPPGREAFPGDIFYLHSRLLERSGKLSAELGGGSLTALPIIETLAGDISSYIPTNVISITDGQLLLDSNLFFSGVKPAINIGYSVSRVGSAAQNKALKKLTRSIKLQLAQYFDTIKFNRFVADVDPATQKVLERGAILVEVFKQDEHTPLGLFSQLLILTAVERNCLTGIPLERLKDYEHELTTQAMSALPQIYYDLSQGKELPASSRKVLGGFLDKFTHQFKLNLSSSSGYAQP